MVSSRTVIVAGATGLVGDELLHQLMGDPDVAQIHVVTRRPINITSDKVVFHQNRELAVTHWQPQWPVPLQGYICLGTTKKEAGGKKGLEDVDLHLVVKVAKMMAVMGVKHLAVVSSAGSHRWSPSHYLRCKGKMEMALRGMGFERLLIARPGPLLGERQRPRADEKILQQWLPVFSFAFKGPLASLEPVKAVDVAKAMMKGLSEPHWPGRSDLKIVPSKTLQNYSA
ncbi:nucleoside-diphosphate sugar epimerase [Veronia nyctiphanis]|uniref:Nucleoside-diphosphate sugar epimerase n=1 Tax=Veronia nyctiphanis TaxID=1278244 RepID=A0A4Q0YR02_9GAMM|nr:oxidoreductase [Veronia nyctiphanis]RXJ73590.1 nucleoside-diphosphate sugar epimerase [Veronia nyctiphanis]